MCKFHQFFKCNLLRPNSANILSSYNTVIISGVDMCSSVQIDKKKDILILNKDSRNDLDNTILTAKKEYSKHFCEQHKKVWLCLHYNGHNSNILADSFGIYKFKAKDAEMNADPTYLGNVLKDFSVDHNCINLMKFSIILNEKAW